MTEKELMKLGEIEASVKSAHKRIDELQLVTQAFYDLASDVKVMVSEMKVMKKDIVDIKTNIDEYHHTAPNKLIFNVKNAIIVALATGLVGSVMALIWK